MAASAESLHDVSMPVSVLSRPVARRRRITPQAGRALEILGHAIEYLTDEYVHRAKVASVDDGELQAVQLLMGINRQIYFACPEAPTMADRWRALLSAGTA